MAGDLNQYYVCKHEVDDRTTLNKESAFLINPKTEGINDNMPENVHLLCGDRRIAGLAPHFVQKCSLLPTPRHRLHRLQPLDELLHLARHVHGKEAGRAGERRRHASRSSPEVP